MSNKENGLEVKVGLFICIGLAVIAAMVIEFGLGGSQGFKKYYQLNVDLPNASGLLKGSEVQLAGARVGYVSSKPDLAGNLGTVRVTVDIEDKYKIPKKTLFKVGSSGLLGDKFVNVELAADFDPEKFNPNSDDAYKPGDTIAGAHEADFTQQATVAIAELRKGLAQVQSILDNLKQGIFSEQSQEDLKQTFANLKTTSANFSEASKGLPPIVKNAQSAVDKANETMKTANGAAEDLRKTLDSVKALVQKAQQGDGLIAQLINNKQLADNINALAVNLREHGVLFYRDSASKNKPPEPAPAKPKKR